LQLARVFHLQRDWTQEVDVLNRVLRLTPGRPEILVQIAAAKRNLGETGPALQIVDQALTLNPSLPTAHGLRGEILGELGRVDEALATLEKAISLNPNSAQAHTGRGHALSELGRLQEAAASFERALELAPGHAAAHYGFSLLHRYAENDPLIARMREAAQKPGLDDDDRSQLFFALAKALEDTGETAESFSFLAQANALRKKLVGYHPQDDEELFAKLAAAAPALMALAGSVEADLTKPVPVFIVGMPRSGTTLIEQILSAGPSVKGAGELNFVKQHGLALATGAEPASPAALAAFAERYLSSVAPLAGGRPFVADKMPHNFRFLPLICAALPQARILHLRRDPRAVSWSNFKHHFVSRSLGYTHDLHDIVAHYHLYDGLMRRWTELCGTRIVDVSYERLTVDQDAETRKMIARLALAWDDAYLRPEANERLVQTASFRQVRQPVYRGSSEAWRSFAPFIGDAFDSLPAAPSSEKP
jgi:tetratricopeptide (TPR) repeat protein